MQNMQFTGKSHDTLNTRTSDGLQVVLEISFQYVRSTRVPNYQPPRRRAPSTPTYPPRCARATRPPRYQFLIEELHALYEDYGADGYLQVYFDVATHLIAEAATEYSAYQFFSSKEAIAIKMAAKLDEYFKTHLHATIISLQIQSSQLPDSFNTAITDTMTQRQNITNAQKYLEQMTVQLGTDVIVAEKARNATITTATGQVQYPPLHMAGGGWRWWWWRILNSCPPRPRLPIHHPPHTHVRAFSSSRSPNSPLNSTSL